MMENNATTPELMLLKDLACGQIGWKLFQQAQKSEDKDKPHQEVVDDAVKQALMQTIECVVDGDEEVNAELLEVQHEIMGAMQGRTEFSRGLANKNMIASSVLSAIKKAIHEKMVETGVEKVETRIATFELVDDFSSDAWAVTNLSELPEEYKTVTSTLGVDKTKIAADILEGLDIPGVAKLERPKHLRVR
jgi:hypothetical protein